MNFDIKELPYSQFEQLGMSKKDVLNMKPENLANLLEGKRTELVTLKINLGEGMQPLTPDAKLSLTRNPDNSVSLGVHPILAKPTNSVGATPDQWEKMLKGEPIVKDSKALNGVMEPHIHQLDKHTNEILTARVSSIQLPNAIKDTVLTPDQKEQLKKGLSVELDRNSKEATHVKLDLNEPKGFKISTEQQTLSINQGKQQEPNGQQIKEGNTQQNKIDGTAKQEVNAQQNKIDGTAKQEGNAQQKTVVEAPTISAGQKLDNKENTAFIVNFHPKEQPQLKDSYLARTNDDVYLRVSHLIKDNNIRVEKFTGLNENDLKAMQQKPRDHYEGKGALVLQTSENSKGVEIKDSGLKSTFEKLNSLQPATAVKFEAPSIKETVSVKADSPSLKEAPAAKIEAPQVAEKTSVGFKR